MGLFSPSRSLLDGVPQATMHPSLPEGLANLSFLLPPRSGFHLPSPGLTQQPLNWHQPFPPTSTLLPELLLPEYSWDPLHPCLENIQALTSASRGRPSQAWSLLPQQPQLPDIHLSAIHLSATWSSLDSLCSHDSGLVLAW